MLCGCKTSTSTSSTPKPLPSSPSSMPEPVVLPPRPSFGWRTLANETLELQALNARQFDIPSKARLRVSVQADSGVFGGVFPSAAARKAPLRRPQFAAARCSLLAVIRGETKCAVNSTSKLVYVIRDKRSEMALGLGAYFAAHHAAKPLEHATAPNRVEIKIDEWRCIGNCPPMPR